VVILSEVLEIKENSEHLTEDALLKKKGGYEKDFIFF